MSAPQSLTNAQAWTKQDLEIDRSWITSLSGTESLELQRAVVRVLKLNIPLDRLRRSDFELPKLGQRLEDIRKQLERGRGFTVLRGLPVGVMNDAELRVLAYGIGTHLGIALSQSKNGEFLAEVRDIGVKKGTAETRAYRTGGELRFHTDRCDLLALLCVRAAPTGGMSKVVSSVTLHNEVLARRPDLITHLYGTYDFSRQSEEAPGEVPWHSSPIFAMQDGQFSSHFSLSFIESAQKYLPVPKLTPERMEAIETLAALAEEHCFQMHLQPGDLQLLNNHVAYHSRTHYVDDTEPGRQRLLLRLWLSTIENRPLPLSEELVWGAVKTGAVRGGVQPAAGRRFAFPDWQAAGWANNVSVD